MDQHTLLLFYLLPLMISAIGGLIEFRNCQFDTLRHALNKAFFLIFRSAVPGLNIFSAVLYLVTCGTFTWKNFCKKSAE